AAGGDAAGGGGVGQHAVVAHQGCGAHLRHHETRFETRVGGEKGRQVFVQHGVHQAVDAALGKGGKAGQRNGHVVELERHGLAVEVAAGKDLLAEDQRVVGGGVQLDGEDAAGLIE